MSLPRYPRYRDTRIEWLGEVPEHWQNQTLNARFSIELGKMLDESRITGRHLLPYLRNVDVQWGKINFEDLPQMDITDAECGRYTIQNGDLLVCEGGESGRAAIVADTPGMIGFQKALHRFRPRDDSEEPKYMYYTLAWASATGVFNTGGSSTITHLTGEQLRRFRFPKPPVEEQRAVSAFLDHETAKIDALISEQQRLLALLKENRQAVISYAVTKGLNPAAAMTDSGIEWLGDVPAHWNSVRLGTLFRETADLGSDELPVLSVSIHNGVSDREFGEDEQDRKVTRSEDRTKYKRVQPGDLVYNMMRAWQGGFGSVTVSGMVSPAYVVARPITGFRTEFIEQVLRTPQAVEELRRHSHGVTDFRLRLYWDEFKSIRVSLPSITEQSVILDSVQQATARIDALSAQAEAGNLLLQERRHALISAAVTGKVDVRRLPRAARDKEAAA
jgi:type I restriction enzyme S subunit